MGSISGEGETQSLFISQSTTLERASKVGLCPLGLHPAPQPHDSLPGDGQGGNTHTHTAEGREEGPGECSCSVH